MVVIYQQEKLEGKWKYVASLNGYKQITEDIDYCKSALVATSMQANTSEQFINSLKRIIMKMHNS